MNDDFYRMRALRILAFSDATALFAKLAQLGLWPVKGGEE